MDAKKINLIWVISLVTMGLSAVILAGGNLARIELTDNVVRICGAIDLVSLPFFAFSTGKKVKNRK